MLHYDALLKNDFCCFGFSPYMFENAVFKF